MPSEQTEKIIGKTSSPERAPNTTGKFSFCLNDGEIINPFDFVVAENSKGTKTIGMITEISAQTDALSHLTNYLSSDPIIEKYVDRLSCNVADTTVFINTGYQDGSRKVEINMPVPNNSPVCFANADMIHKAIGMDNVKDEDKIPAGVIMQSNGTKVPVYLDSRYLLSPEGAHINVSGISGLATKTSYLLFLLNSLYQKMESKVALIIFNVKQRDLLQIDQLADLSEDHKGLYNCLGLQLRSFPEEKVRYFLPRNNDGNANSEIPLPKKYQVYSYELSDIADRLNLLFSDVPDEWQTISDFVIKFGQEWDNDKINIENSEVKNWNDLKNVNVSDLNKFFEWGGGGQVGKRIKRILNRQVSNGVFVNNRSSGSPYIGEEIGKIKAGDVFVIDIFRVPDNLKPFVVGDVMRSVDRLFGEKAKEELPRVVIMIDELNTFAPKEDNAITKQIREIASKGRSRGTILFGAEQFKSEVDEQIVGNCSTHVIGRTSGIEVSKPVYRIDESIKHSVTTLDKGELILAFPTWRRPVKIIFPAPCCKKMD